MTTIPARKIPLLLPSLLTFLLFPAYTFAQKDAQSRAWNLPVEPFQILGNLYYVGAKEIASYLIATPQGHILLDGGFAETAPMIARHVERLGFRLSDVKILLSSHAHYDHAGGLAELKKETGAKLVASERDAPLLAAGGKGDFRWGDELTFPLVQADRTVHDGEQVTLGDATLTAHLTPGHTKGCTTWTMRVEEAGSHYDVVFVGSPTINPGVRLAVDPSYPGIAEDYATTFRVLKSLPCDVFLGAHGSFFGLSEKILRLKKGAGPNPFLDPQGYRAFVTRSEKVYLDQLKSERAP
ncbi:MAG TPA: subclass B3 metallo-beta-lactamase [Thermoanaerobaculia bacterium]|nr:subclass B3 metallo-beta-lactamase [Thermoanaerobaculia bacterium]